MTKRAVPPSQRTDDDGDDVSRVIRLLEYARERGFRIGPALEVGSIKLMVTDLRQESIGDPVGSRSFYAEHGIDEQKDSPPEGTFG